MHHHLHHVRHAVHTAAASLPARAVDRTADATAAAGHHLLPWIALTVCVLAAITVRIVPRDARIVDGDTIAVRGRKWRLAGFDAPERDQPGGSEATARLRAILEREHVIAVVYGLDRYRRTLARCYTLRGPLSWRMMGSGHAHATTATGVLPVAFARAGRLGIWNGRHDVVSPKRWRATHPKPMGFAETLGLGTGRGRRRQFSLFEGRRRRPGRMHRFLKRI